jgi:probable rRNA maturation factor
MPIEIANRSGLEMSGIDLISLLEYAMQAMGVNSQCELSVLLVDEAEMSELHIKWMDEPGPTDVLSFPMDEIRPNTQVIGALGDIVLCPTIAQAQALAALHSFEKEIAVLSVHGLLHILGYDHANATEEREMFDLQDSIVKRWSA